MIDQKKIRIMTALAIYDKHWGENDRKVDSYYRMDYIYKNNCWTRICICIGLCILFMFYGLHMVFVREIDFASINYTLLAEKWIFIFIVVLIGYTALGTALSIKEYEKANRRLSNYHKLLDRLEILNAQNITEQSKGTRNYGRTMEGSSKGNRRL